MGTLIFWITWAAVLIFYSVTTPKQRQTWFWLVCLLAVASLLTASILNAAEQGYITYP